MNLTPNLHPSRLPALAMERQRLRQEQKTKPETFSADQQKRLDEYTDQLILAMATSMARMSQELVSVQSRSRHPGMR